MESSGQTGPTGGPETGTGSSASPPSWQQSPTPAPGGQASGTGGAGGWAAAPAQSVPGTAGYFYADVPNRAIAYIIDAIILVIIGSIVGVVLTGITGPTATPNPNPTNFNDLLVVNYGAALVSAVVSALINAAYFIGTWTKMRGSPGQKILGMQVGNETDGATLTLNQAVTRWLLLGAPLGLASALAAGLPTVGLLIGLAGLVWFIILLVTTAQSPTKQGLHDRYAKSVVVKAGRSVG